MALAFVRLDRVHDLVQRLLLGLVHGCSKVVAHASLDRLAGLDQVQALGSFGVALAKQPYGLTTLPQTSGHLFQQPSQLSESDASTQSSAVQAKAYFTPRNYFLLLVLFQLQVLGLVVSMLLPVGFGKS